MADDSDLDRTESPSERRLERARDSGQVARSRELSTFILMAGAAGVLYYTGAGMLDGMRLIMAHGLTLSRGELFGASTLGLRFSELTWQALLVLAPLFIALALGAIGASLLLGGWVFSAEAFAPQYGRIDPLAGIKRMFSLHGATELGKALLKATLLSAIGAWVLWDARSTLDSLGRMPLGPALREMGHLLASGLLWMCLGLAAVALVDVPLQLTRLTRMLRMTRQEVRDENRELLGDPRLKARIRSLQRAAARRRMMAQVPKADVVVVNPSHFAVALLYRESMRAPRVVAKGRDILALRIRELATENRVPILEAPPLARALYRHTELDDEIPVALYEAVALVMAYTYQLRRYRQSGGAIPLLPPDLPVPDGLDPYVEGASA